MRAEDGAELGRECESVRGREPVDRIGTGAVVDQNEFAGLLVEHDGAERTAQRAWIEPFVPIQGADDGGGPAAARLAELLKRRLELRFVVQIAVKQHAHRTVAGQLCGRLKHAQMDAAEGPALAGIDPALDDQTSAARHDATHGLEAGPDTMTPATTDDSEQTRHAAISPSTVR